MDEEIFIGAGQEDEEEEDLEDDGWQPGEGRVVGKGLRVLLEGMDASLRGLEASTSGLAVTTQRTEATTRGLAATTQRTEATTRGLLATTQRTDAIMRGLLASNASQSMILRRLEAGDVLQRETNVNTAAASERAVGRSVVAGLHAWAQAAVGRKLVTFEERKLARISANEVAIELDVPLVAQLEQKSPAVPAALKRQVFAEVKATVTAEDVEEAPLRTAVVGTWTAAAVAVTAADRAAAAAGSGELCGRDLPLLAAAAVAIVREHAAIEGAAAAELLLAEHRRTRAELQGGHAAAAQQKTAIVLASLRQEVSAAAKELAAATKEGRTAVKLETRLAIAKARVQDTKIAAQNAGAHLNASEAAVEHTADVCARAQHAFKAAASAHLNAAAAAARQPGFLGGQGAPESRVALPARAACGDLFLEQASRYVALLEGAGCDLASLVDAPAPVKCALGGPNFSWEVEQLAATKSEIIRVVLNANVHPEIQGFE